MSPRQTAIGLKLACALARNQYIVEINFRTIADVRNFCRERLLDPIIKVCKIFYDVLASGFRQKSVVGTDDDRLL